MEPIPELKHKSEFVDVLTGYLPNQKVIAEFNKSKVGIIAGVAGAGKDTVRELLIKSYPHTYQKLLSDTTRPKRPGEEDGVQYWFRDEEDVLAGLRGGRYLQGALIHDQQVSALSVEQLRDARDGYILLPILVVQAEPDLYKMNPNIKTVFLVPPDLFELIERLQTNKSMTLDEIDRRLDSARKEMQIVLDTPRYYCITTVHPEMTLGFIDAYFRSDQRDETADQAARQNIQQIMEDIANR